MVGGLGILLVVVGALFLGQGVGWIGGSSMTGERQWAFIGGALIAVGAGLLFAARLRERS